MKRKQWAEMIADRDREIERLRNTIKNCPPVSESEYVRRLEDEIERLRAALKEIIDLVGNSDVVNGPAVYAVCCAALDITLAATDTLTSRAPPIATPPPR